MFLALLITGLFLDEHFPAHKFWSYFFGAGVLVVTGIVDDRHGLGARSKFLAQGIATMIMVMSDIHLVDLGNLYGSGLLSLGSFAIPVTVFATLGVINSINMADGMDGLAGGFSLVALLAFGFVCIQTNHPNTLVLVGVLSGGVLGFLIFNFRMTEHRLAKVFMGDAGSLFLGFSLAWLAIKLSMPGELRMSPTTALWILALPLMDTVSLMLRRVAHGKNPFVAGRDHLHHILLRAGYSHSQTVWIMLAIASLLALIGLVGWRLNLPEPLMFWGFIGLFLCYYFAVHHAWRFTRLLKRLGMVPVPSSANSTPSGLAATATPPARK